MDSRNENLSEMERISCKVKEIDEEIEKLKTEKHILLERKEKIKELLQRTKNKNVTNKNWALKTFPWSEKVDSLLRSVFNIPNFRPFQLEVINATLSKEDVILIMPTGGGKSLCFQLPALVDEGVTLVVSPLVSLMEDQLMALKKINYPAVMLSASSSKEDLKLAMTALKEISSIKIIYVTPEKLAKSKRFMSQLQKCYEQGRFSRLVVDEVHCCSTWGHDFRPDYTYLGILKDMFQGVPLLGLTATSTSKVTADIQKMLNIQGCLVIKATFNRPNLYYEVVAKPSTQNENIDLLETWLKERFKDMSGIIYTTAIKECEELTKELRKRNVKAGVYHALLDASVRSKMHAKWISGEYKVMVATIAFGMGIDKSDVRFVIHHSLSKSMENFYQESGRAGRDGSKSQCILMYRLADIFKLSTMVFTQQTGLENLYCMLNYCIDGRSCRRSLIAQHFDEVWESNLCNKMCDHCKKPCNIKKIDVVFHCRCLYKIIERAHDMNLKVTALKILDAWFAKGDNKFRVPNVKCPFDKITAEHVFGFLLIKGYLKEDFHYTAYSTISYIKKGPKCVLLEDLNHQIIFESSTLEKSQLFMEKPRTSEKNEFQFEKELVDLSKDENKQETSEKILKRSRSRKESNDTKKPKGNY